MNFLELVSERFSVRKFSDKPIPEDKWEYILEAGRHAPTALNLQPQKIYILKSPEAVAKMRSLTKYVYDSPYIIMFCYDTRIRRQGEMDSSIVATHMMLAAWEQGIGSCWVTGFNPVDVAMAFQLPSYLKVASLMPIGYAADNCYPSRSLHFSRKSLDETVSEL